MTDEIEANNINVQRAQAFYWRIAWSVLGRKSRLANRIGRNPCQINLIQSVAGRSDSEYRLLQVRFCGRGASPK